MLQSFRSATLAVLAASLLIATPGFAQVTLTGTLDATSPPVTPSNGRPTRNATQSVCGAVQPAPGPIGATTNSYAYRVIPLVNTGPARCVTVEVTGANCTGGQGVYPFLYRGAFNPLNQSQNHGAHSLTSSPDQVATASFGVDLNAGEAVNVVLYSLNATATGGSCDYTLTSAELTAPPAVSGISPASGPTTGGTNVVITGQNFAGTTSVTFGGTAASSFTVNSATQIVATSPPRAAGAAEVRVMTAAGTSPDAGASDDFTYGSPTPVPTLSEWALILFGALLAGGAALATMRRRLAA
jgi:large repetitive protein